MGGTQDSADGGDLLAAGGPGAGLSPPSSSGGGSRSSSPSPLGPGTITAKDDSKLREWRSKHNAEILEKSQAEKQRAAAEAEQGKKDLEHLYAEWEKRKAAKAKANALAEEARTRDQASQPDKVWERVRPYVDLKAGGGSDTQARMREVIIKKMHA